MSMSMYFWMRIDLWSASLAVCTWHSEVIAGMTFLVTLLFLSRRIPHVVSKSFNFVV